MAPALSIATAATSLLAGLNVTSPVPSPSTPTHSRHHNTTRTGSGATVTIPVVLPPSGSSSPCTTTGLASPTVSSSYGSCKPNFQGQPVHIRSAGTSTGWCVPKGGAEGTPLGMVNNSDTSFRLEFNGQPQNDYIIKLVGPLLLIAR
jgi:hypothetical protein